MFYRIYCILSDCFSCKTNSTEYIYTHLEHKSIYYSHSSIFLDWNRCLIAWQNCYGRFSWWDFCDEFSIALIASSKSWKQKLLVRSFICWVGRTKYGFYFCFDEQIENTSLSCNWFLGWFDYFYTLFFCLFTPVPRLW